jgi:hypothetical protein
MLKLILDGLNKIAWADDHQVSEVTGRKILVRRRDDARTSVRLYTTGVLPSRVAQCQRCGREFPRPPSHAAKKFCGDTCRRAARKESRRRKCAHCGEPFYAHSESSSTRYCSIACAAAAKHVDATCVNCGADFTRPRHLNRSGNAYCSPECKATYWRERRKSAAKGTCQDCGGPTTKKTYLRCRDCQYAAGGRWAYKKENPA